jgi:hypothetical protein
MRRTQIRKPVVIKKQPPLDLRTPSGRQLPF